MDEILSKIKTTCKPKTGSNFVDIKGNKFICPTTCSEPCTVTIDQITKEPYYDSKCVTNVVNDYLSGLGDHNKIVIDNECNAGSNNTTSFKNNIIALCNMGVTQIADASTSCKLNKLLHSKTRTRTEDEPYIITFQDIIVFSCIVVGCLIICTGYLDISLKILFVLLFLACGCMYYLYQFNKNFKKLVLTP